MHYKTIKHAVNTRFQQKRQTQHFRVWWSEKIHWRAWFVLSSSFTLPPTLHYFFLSLSPSIYVPSSLSHPSLSLSPISLSLSIPVPLPTQPSLPPSQHIPSFPFLSLLTLSLPPSFPLHMHSASPVLIWKLVLQILEENNGNWDNFSCV